VNQHLADLVGGIGVFAFLGVVVLKQEVPVAVFDVKGSSLRLTFD
jgi:hypothetical protein